MELGQRVGGRHGLRSSHACAGSSRSWLSASSSLRRPRRACASCRRSSSSGTRARPPSVSSSPVPARRSRARRRWLRCSAAESSTTCSAACPAGEPLLELGEPGEPEILVSLPPPGRSENDVRYPIAVLGWDGLLTSSSTRIDGLVSDRGRRDRPAARGPVGGSRRRARAARPADRAKRPLAPAAHASRSGPSCSRSPSLDRRSRSGRSWSRSRRISGSSPHSPSRRGWPPLVLPLGLACTAVLVAVSPVDGPRRRDGRAVSARAVTVGPLLRDQQPARDAAARAVARRRGALLGSAGLAGGAARARHGRRQPLRRGRRRARRARGRLRRARAAPRAGCA